MDRHRRGDRPIIRRDADGAVSTARTWESLTERLIREAQEAGAFEDLPRRGQPLQLDDDRYAGDMASANRMMRNAGAAPPWIEADRTVRELADEIEAVLVRAGRSPSAARMRLQRELESLAAEHDSAVARLESMAPTARQQRPRLDRAALAARLANALGEDPRA